MRQKQIQTHEPVKKINKLKYILPFLLSVLTDTPRYEVVPKWSNNSWVHNIFRAYELIFWRRCGIRMEILTFTDGKNVTSQAFTFEGACALAETAVRKLIKRWQSVRVFIPALETTAGFSVMGSGFMFAIAFDAESDPAGWAHNAALVSWSHTVTGTDPGLVTEGGTQYGLTPVSADYAGAGMTAITTFTSTANNNHGGFYKQAPATGANTLNFNFTTGSFAHMFCVSKSYSGVNQSALIDSAAGGTVGSGTTLTIATTVVGANCWLVGGCIISNGTNQSPSTTSNVTDRKNYIDSNHYISGSSSDSNGTVATGSQSIVWTHGATISEGLGLVYSLAIAVPFDNSPLFARSRAPHIFFAKPKVISLQ